MHLSDRWYIKYIDNLEQALNTENIRAELHIMRSNGGVATAKTISRIPVNTMMSGLAAGVLGGSLGRRTGTAEKRYYI